MSYQFDATKQQGFFKDVDLGLNGTVFTMMVDGRYTSGQPANGALLWLGDGSKPNDRLFIGRSSDRVRVFVRAADNTSDPGSFPIDTWKRIIVEVDSITPALTCWVEGDPKTYNFNPGEIQLIDFKRWALGYSADNSPSAFSTGNISQSTIFKRALSQNERDALFSGTNPFDLSPQSYLPLIDGLRDWDNLINNPTIIGTDSPVLVSENPIFDPPNGYKEITVGAAVAGIGEWGYRDDPLDQYGTIDDDSFDQFGDKITGLYENQEDQPGNIPAFFLEVEPNGIAENQIISVDVGATGQRLQVGIYGDNGGYGEITRDHQLKGNIQIPTRNEK